MCLVYKGMPINNQFIKGISLIPEKIDTAAMFKAELTAEAFMAHYLNGPSMEDSPEITSSDSNTYEDMDWKAMYPSGV